MYGSIYFFVQLPLLGIKPSMKIAKPVIKILISLENAIFNGNQNTDD